MTITAPSDQSINVHMLQILKALAIPSWKDLRKTASNVQILQILKTSEKAQRHGTIFPTFHRYAEGIDIRGKSKQILLDVCDISTGSSVLFCQRTVVPGGKVFPTVINVAFRMHPSTNTLNQQEQGKHGSHLSQQQSNLLR